MKTKAFELLGNGILEMKLKLHGRQKKSQLVQNLDISWFRNLTIIMDLSRLGYTSQIAQMCANWISEDHPRPGTTRMMPSPPYLYRASGTSPIPLLIQGDRVFKKIAGRNWPKTTCPNRKEKFWVGICKNQKMVKTGKNYFGIFPKNEIGKNKA